MIRNALPAVALLVVLLLATVGAGVVAAGGGANAAGAPAGGAGVAGAPDRMTDTSAHVVPADGTTPSDLEPRRSPDANATVFHEGEHLTVAATGGQLIRGNTTLTSGTEIAVSIRSPGGESPFFKRQYATVASDGEFAVVFAFDDAEPGQNFTVRVRGPNGTLTELEGETVEGDADLGLPESDVSVADGEVATLPIVVDAGTTATLSIRREAVGYRLNATITDGDGDGRVVVQFDTAIAGTDGDPLAVATGTDEVRLRSETHLDGPLPEGQYAIALGIDGAELLVGSLYVEGAERTATTTTTPSAGTPARSGHPELDPTVTLVPAGRTAELSVSLGNASAATLSIGGDDVNYALNATVRDGNGDDRVVVQFDTGAAGTEGRTLSTAAADDEVTVRTERSLADPPLDAGEYRLDLYRGEDVPETKVDVGTLIVEAAPTTAPPDGATVSPTATPTPTPGDRDGLTPTGTVTVDQDDRLPADPGVLALGGIAVLGLGAALILSHRR